MSYNLVLNTSMPAHYLVRSPFWQPTVFPLTGYTSPMHTPYHSCICYYQHVEITPVPWGGLAWGGGGGGVRRAASPLLCVDARVVGCAPGGGGGARGGGGGGGGAPPPPKKCKTKKFFFF